jgi:adenosylmethionine-8-amino-7-oxononanoate aminotransferase
MPLSLPERDERVVWHPYTQHLNRLPPIAAVRGEGALIYDASGKSYIDAVSSWWVNIHGHAHPYIAEKIFAQAKELEHVIFTHFTHEPAVRLAERLLSLLPGAFSKIFFSDNGSTAVEVALKMAIQYWQNQESGSKRCKVLALPHAYHGDTFGAMSVSQRGLFTNPFRDYLFDVSFLEEPLAGNMDRIRSTLDTLAPQLACFIYEPLLQAAGGMRMGNPQLLDEILGLLKARGVLLIADEVMTGFGRTGKYFSGEYLHNKADILCMSKGLTGGVMALGLTAASQPVYEAFLSGDRERTFFHGHSFTANPLACSAALASLDLLEAPSCLENIQRITQKHLRALDRLGRMSGIKNARSLGTVLAFEIDAGNDHYLNEIGPFVMEQALHSGIYLRPLGNTIYLMPPYCIRDGELDALYEFLVRMIGKIN